MKRIIFAAAVVSAGTLFFSTGAEAANIKEGQWSMTTVIRMEGMDEQTSEAMKEMENMSPEEKAVMQKMMGGMKIGAQGGGMAVTTTQCLTNDDPVPEAQNEKNCKQTHSVKGNTVTFEMVCPKSRSNGQVTYKNDTMKGTIKSTQIEKGKETNATIDISGQYVGPCQGNTSPGGPGAFNVPAQGLSQKELAIRQKELDLQQKELELKKKELDLQASADKGKNKSSDKSGLKDVNDAANTTHNVTNALGGIKSLLGY